MSSIMLEALRGMHDVYEVREPGEDHTNVHKVENGIIQADSFRVPDHGPQNIDCVDLDFYIVGVIPGVRGSEGY